MFTLNVLASFSDLTNQNKANLLIIGGFLLIISIPIIGIIRDNIKSKKNAKKEKDTSLWDYEFYKNKKYLLNNYANSLIDELTLANLSEKESKKMIDDFNSIENNSLKITYAMIDFERQLQKEEEPKRIKEERKKDIVHRLRNFNYEKSKESKVS